MKGKDQTQRKGFGYVVAASMAVLLIVVAKNVYDDANAPFGNALFQGINARPATYFAEPSEPFCLMEGVWHNWEEDQTITLGCLEVKGNIREGSYSFATGPRATWNYSISGTYDLESDGSMQAIGKNQAGKDVKVSTTIHVDDTEYPTQMIVIDKLGVKSLYIWKRKE
jgi:hypothetical protein